jgi:hypothetical protein|tara:strand:- start:62 stop:277 length:216 start_codon:yes stop_codon:yes gene_type:complete
MVFKIFASICFLSIGTGNQTLCFKSEVPLQYETIKQCTLDRDKIVDYMHSDLVERQITILFTCKETNQIKL